MRFAGWAALAAALVAAAPAGAARYYEFQVTGSALRTNVYSVLSSYPQPFVLGIYTLNYTSTDTFAFDTGSFAAVPDTTEPGWNGYPYPQIATNYVSNPYPTYNSPGNYEFVLETNSLSSPAYLSTLNMPGGPKIGFGFSFGDVAIGDTFQPLKITGGGFSYAPIIDGRGPYTDPTGPGQIISVLARTTDVAPASLRATEQLVVSVLPEPETWATMILGFGLAGAVLRRQRRRTAALAF
jgi:hypothetical protein